MLMRAGRQWLNVARTLRLDALVLRRRWPREGATYDFRLRNVKRVTAPVVADLEPHAWPAAGIESPGSRAPSGQPGAAPRTCGPR